MTDKTDWDNLSDMAQSKTLDLVSCRAKCESEPTCRQFSFVAETSQCRTRSDPRLGKPANGTESGWIVDRVTDITRNVVPCGDEGWQVGAKTRKTVCN